MRKGARFVFFHVTAEAVGQFAARQDGMQDADCVRVPRTAACISLRNELLQRAKQKIDKV